jgi:hypothetical protein
LRDVYDECVVQYSPTLLADGEGERRFGGWEFRRRGQAVTSSRYPTCAGAALVDDPDVLLLVIGTDLDLMGPAPAGLFLEHLVEVRPLVERSP